MVLMTPLMIAIPSVYPRAVISLLTLLLLSRIEGLEMRTGRLRNTLKSSVVAFLMVIPFVLISKVEYSGSLTLESLLDAVIFHLSVSTWEEVVYRGYPLVKFSILTLVASSLLFSLIHALNPGFGPMAFLGIMAAGMYLGLLRYLWGLLPAISFHLIWNLTLEHLWGLPTSGIRGASIFSSRPSGPELLTGGAFGPEASLISLAEFSLLTLLLSLRMPRTSTAHLKG